MESLRPLPWFLSEIDEALAQATARRDPLGILPVWSARGRRLVPHLTEQTGRAEGFELLLTILGLWPRFADANPALSGEVRAFYLVIEQAFARATGHARKDWPLPGRRRVLARLDATWTGLSVRRRAWHLTGNQLANGTWGLYRGAADRAGLLGETLRTVRPEVLEELARRPSLPDRVEGSLFGLVRRALEAPEDEVKLPLDGGDRVAAALAAVLPAAPAQLPHAGFLWQRLVDAFPATRALVERLRRAVPTPDARLDHRGFLLAARNDLPAHSEAIEQVLRCETLLAPVEAIFRWLCRQTGKTLDRAAAALPADLGLLRDAHAGFHESGPYPPGGADGRWRLYRDRLDLQSPAALLESLLACHAKVAEERGTAPWIALDESGRLLANAEVEDVRPQDMIPALAWRNDYYLQPLASVARGLGFGDAQ